MYTVIHNNRETKIMSSISIRLLERNSTASNYYIEIRVIQSVPLFVLLGDA